MAQAGDAFRPDVPSTARMYDYYLGGKDNYPADRAAAERVIAMMPNGVVRTSAVQNRKFLMRVVRYLAEELSIRQFLDIGTGLPTMNSVHQVAQASAPDSRVVYVDHDPVVLAHSRDLLHGNDRTAIIGHDLRDPAGILADPDLHELLDLSQPVAVLLVAVLHFIPDADDPGGIITALMEPLPEGSCLVISHLTADSYSEADLAAQEYHHATSTAHSRHRSEVVRFFSGYQLAGPRSVVWTPQWRRPADEPEDDPDIAANPGRSLCWCGVGRKVSPGSLEQPDDEAEAFLGAPAAVDGRTADDVTSDGTPSVGPPSVGTAAGTASFPWPPVDRPGARQPPAYPPPGYPELRPDIPNVARMYDYMLGGKDNYPTDRAAAERTFAVLGEDVVRGTVRQNRQFLVRAVRYLAADLGLRQFIDIGTGLPTMNSVHEVTQRVAPDSRVVYVDNDPVVLAHARDMLNALPGTMIADHDLRDPASIIFDGQIRSLLDFGQPVAVLLIAILHFLSDAEDPGGLASGLMSALPSGSCLVISHLTADHYTQAKRAATVYAETTQGLHLRSRAAVESLFGGLPLLPPGQLVYAADWHPDPDTLPASAPGGSALWCGAARKS